MTTKFYAMMKKRGFSETLYALGDFEEEEAVQSKFFEKIEESDSYYNAYLRVKKMLLDNDLIKFKLNPKNEKVIFLTDKGKDVLNKIKEIEGLLKPIK